MNKRHVVAAVALGLMLSAPAVVRAVDVRGYLQTGSYQTVVDSVIFTDSTGMRAFNTRGWGGLPDIQDSFDFAHLAGWPGTALLCARVGSDTATYTTYVRTLVEDTWYTLNIHPAWEEPQVMFTTNPHAGIGGAVAVRTRGLSLSPGRPNPFADLATIGFANDVPGRLELVVMTATGARVRTLTAGLYAAGTHSLNWNACDERNHPAPNGVYFCRLVAGEAALTTRLVLQR
jgi:hypothetical protein